MLAASIDEGLVDQFWDTVPKGVKNKHVLSAAARLWVSLPEELRRELFTAEAEDNARSDAWVQAVRKIAAEEFEVLSRKSRKKD